MPATQTIRIGLISDTHGLVREEAVAALKGCRHILHAGDIDEPDVLVKLRRLAPVTVVRGNNDRGAWAEAIPVYDVVEFGSVSVYLRQSGGRPHHRTPCLSRRRMDRHFLPVAWGC
jgi:predicted phosphodiesterase